MRTLLLGLLTVVLSLLSFLPAAHADMIDPGNPYRRPHRPELDPIPVTKVYKMREPDFTLKKEEETKDTYLLRATPSVLTVELRICFQGGWYPLRQ